MCPTHRGAPSGSSARAISGGKFPPKLPCARLAVVLALVVASTIPAGTAWAAPFGNPVLGPTPAPMTLEYFTAIDCPACEQFEREVLPRVLLAQRSTPVRVVVRQLPAPEVSQAMLARALLCLPVDSDYLARRAELKHPAPAGAVRESGCRSERVATDVLEFNAAVFRLQGFPGTPAFLLTRHDGAAALGRRSWAGRTTWQDWQSELARLSAPSSDGRDP